MSSSISQAFKSLNVAAAETTSDHENIYEVSYQLLKNVRNFQDVHSFHNCLIALINLDKYHKAFQLIGQVSELVHSSFVVEKAYVYYKLGKTDLLLALYKGHQQDDSITSRALKHIVAQNFYKEGENSDALVLYHELISSNKDIDSILDLACNERAIISQTNFITNNSMSLNSSVVAALAEEEVTYDLLFNESLILLSQNKYDLSLRKLQEADQLCHTTVVDEEDLLIELTPIKLTTAYIYQILNQQSKAAEILSGLKLESINDSMMKLIIANNYYSINTDNDTAKNESVDLLVERELDYEKNLTSLQSKLTKPQYQSIIKNNLLLSYSSSTLSKSSSYFRAKFLGNWSKTFEGDLTPFLFKTLTKLGITHDEIFAQSQPEAGLNKKVFKHTKEQQQQQKEVESPEFISSLLLLVFLNHMSSKYEQSISILEPVCETKVIPSLVGLLIRIYEILNLTKKLQILINNVAEHILTNIDEKSTSDFYHFAKIIAFKLLLIDETKAKSIFSRLLEINPQDKLIQSILNENEDIIQLDSIEDLTSSTRPIDELLKVEIEELIQLKTNNKPIRKSITNKSTSLSSKVTKKKEAKFSSKKVIKPEGEFKVEDLDKERWLPLKLRSYYKPSKKDKKKGLGGHQGSVEPVSAPSNNSGNSSNKKKKKGKK